jgi:hypothetical protein
MIVPDLADLIWNGNNAQLAELLYSITFVAAG